jgi:hypothetical protein
LKKGAITLAFGILLLGSSARADIFVYELQSEFESVHVKFELPSFEEVIPDQTAFDIATWTLGTITDFALSGNSSNCPSFLPLLIGPLPGPCWETKTTSGALFAQAGLTSDFASFAFSGPGTYTAYSGISGSATTLTITDVPSSVPEPTSILLLASIAGAVVWRVRRRMA